MFKKYSVAVMLVGLVCCVFQASANPKVDGILEISSIYENWEDEPNKDEASDDQQTNAEIVFWDEPSLESNKKGILDSSETLSNSAYGYELIGANVYEIKKYIDDELDAFVTWYKIFRIDTQEFVWIKENQDMTLHSIQELLIEGLVHTDVMWDGVLLDSLGESSTKIDLSNIRGTFDIGAEFREAENLGDRPAYDELSATVVSFDQRDDITWMLVILFDESVCLKDYPRVVATGWMRLHSDFNRTNAWFSSKGC